MPSVAVRREVEIAQAFCHRADFAIADLAIVDFRDCGQFSHCGCAKHFMRAYTSKTDKSI